ncbi:sortase [Leptolinea tardivitalis]|uniref:sortase n=1 Tax=Leptolinea tardivitalis TaxID=229920 RepID=UPI0007806F07|nr:class D sortase [Leptolinea tardivitalis]GAP22053.1 LPXTG-site transpeptidase [Leptolinea tardivitalis]
MEHNHPVDQYTLEELQSLLAEKRMKIRRERLAYYRRTGRIVTGTVVESGFKPGRILNEPGEVKEPAAVPSKRKIWIDRLLVGIEIVAVIGLVFVLLNGVSILRNLNKEVASSLVQPTLAPTAIIQAVVLPSGHTPPNAPGGVQPNEEEIPAHLRPLVQSMAAIPLPTASPEQAVRIQIPAINVDAPVIQGDGWEQLKKGVGQHAGTPNPGEGGNVVLSAHNDVFGEIFRDLDKLKTGDTIVLFTNLRTYTYVINQSRIVLPAQVEVMSPTTDSVVTLISCYPYMVDNRRIVITAVLKNS